MSTAEEKASNLLDQITEIIPEIKELNIQMHDGKSDKELKKEYEDKKAKFIAKYMKDYDYSKNKAEGSWLEIYPKEVDSYVSNYAQLTTNGEQSLIDKIDELVRTVNKLVRKANA